MLGLKTGEIYRQIGRQASVDDDPSVARLMLESAIAHFIAKGNPSILASVLDRVEGPPKEPKPEAVATVADDREALDIFEAIELVRLRRASQGGGLADS